MSSSIISTIKQAILTETPSDVSIRERSLVSFLIEKNGEGEPLTWSDFKIKLNLEKPLVITRFFIQLLNKIILAGIWLFYGAYNIIHKILTGRWRGMKPSSGINTVILATTLIMAIIVLLGMLMFLIRDVVFAPNTAHVNSKGVLTVDQPCYVTQSFFLLNAATYWTSTDISISKGDRVFLSASGSMYSDIGDVYSAAYKNDTLLYHRSAFGPFLPNANDTIGVKYCIFGRYPKDRKDTCLKTAARYGSLLFQICNSHAGPKDYNDDNDECAIQQVNFAEFVYDRDNSGINYLKNLINSKRQYSFVANKSGVLYLTFNDILLDNAMIDTLVRDSTRATTIWNDLKTTLLNNVHDSNLVDSLKCKIKDSTIWFQDNVGEILVNIRIEKNIWESDMRWYKKPVIWFYRVFEKCSTKPFWGYILPQVFLIIFAYFGIDIFISSILRRRKQKKTNNHKNVDIMTKEEFKMLVMLYAANIDGKIDENEVDAILSKADVTVFEKMKKQFKKLSDIDVLACINDNKEKYASSQEDKQQLLNDIREVIMADKCYSSIESQLLRVVKNILN